MVILLYFIGAIGLSVCTLNPFYVATSFVCGALYLVALKGIKNYLKNLLFWVVMLLFITVTNVFTNSLGLSVLFKIYGYNITAEALIYGLCSGGMFVCVMQWFLCYNEVMSNDKIISLLGRVFPSLAVCISMTLRYIPDTIKRAKEINTAQAAMLGAKPKNKLKNSVRLSGILLSWSLESSIETAISMQNKNYSLRRKNKTIKTKWQPSDVLLFTVILALLICVGLSVILSANSFSFYPFLSTIRVTPLLFLYLLFLLFPLILQGKEQLYWLFYRS